MAAFQPTFKLMLVSLHLVVFLGLQSTPALANRLHANHDGTAPNDNAIRRHAARAGRLSKRFPTVSGTNTPTLNRRQRHHRFGLTPAQIEELLNNEEVDYSDLYTPASNSTNATSTSSHTRHRTHSTTDTEGPTGTAFQSFALPTSNSTSPSNTTSSVASSATPSLHSHSHRHSSSSSTQSSDTASTPSSSATSSSIPTSSASKDDGSNGLGGLLSTLLSPSSSSSSPAAQQTSGSHAQQGNTGSSDDDGQDSTPHSSSRASSPSATSSRPSNSDDNSDDTPAWSSNDSKTTQPDFYSFMPRPTSSSTQAAPSSTSAGLLHGILPGLGQSSSASSAASATPTPTASPPDSNNGGHSASDTGSDVDWNTASSKGSSNSADPTDGPLDQSPTSTSNGASPTSTGNGTAPTGSADGSDGTASHTRTATTTDGGTGSSSTVTAGPTSTSQGSVTAPTGTNAGNGSDSGSSVDQQSSSASNTAAPAATSTASNGSDSGSCSSSASRSASAASTSTTNPYWYANTQSLNLAPSSTLSAEQPAETGSKKSTDGDKNSSSTTDTNNEPDSSTAWLPGPGSNTPSTPAPQDLPTTIVPSADSYNQPDNTTSIGLLFKQEMKWTWVISQADLTAQIFAFMPDLVGRAVSLDSSRISTVKLASYSPETGDAATTSTLTTARALYMAYVPTENVEDIQAMVSNTSSPFYTSAAAGAPQQLASQVDPTFNILSAAGQVAAGAKQKSTSGSGAAKDDSTLRNSLIGVGCGLAGCFAIAVGGLLWRKQRKDKVEAGAGGNNGGISRAHTIRSFSGGLRETWAPDALDQHRALDTAGQMQQVWSPHDGGMGMAMGHSAQPMQSHSDGFGGYVASDPFHDAANVNAAGGYANMNRSSRMTERSNYSDLSQMTEAQRIQYDYESSRRSFHSNSDHSNSHGSHSEHSTESAGMLSTYQDDYRVPRQHTSNHAFGATPPPRSNSVNRVRRRGSVASSTIGRPEMMSNSVLL
ncbi:hypothetical protein NDA16_001113 [Ustilago loliicola]|nr:hypothetical protein NDA16_001113 [Ustilago loliicola]